MMKLLVLALLLTVALSKSSYKSLLKKAKGLHASKYASKYTSKLKAWKTDQGIKTFPKLDHKSAFLDWAQTFPKSYSSPEEESNRYSIFLQNWKLINEHNLGNHTFKMGLNQFSDLTPTEFKQYIHGHNNSCLLSRPASFIPHISLKISEISSTAPLSVDWAAAGYVTAVKNQGSCGSCWAFSATGCTESRSAIALQVTGDDIVSLSEQQLMDCSSKEGNEGCDGGLMDYAFEYIEKNGGLCSEADYPYEGVVGTCNSTACGTSHYPISSHSDVVSDSYSSLENAVADGPVSIAIQANQLSFQHYSSGVLSGECGTSLDHGVLVVGYGTDSGSKYWKVKNSWGSTWGEDGYVLICRECGMNDGDGECGILMQPSYDVPSVSG